MIKVGDSIYLCRTCSREYNHSTEICGRCYAAESQKHQSHEFAKLMVQRVTDLADDPDVQIKNWWRCTFPGCNLGRPSDPSYMPFSDSLTDVVTGPSIEWLHRHTEARLCLGDALMDFCRVNSSHQCFKTFSYRSRLTEPSNSTSIKCGVCRKGKPPVPLCAYPMLS